MTGPATPDPRVLEEFARRRRRQLILLPFVLASLIIIVLILERSHAPAIPDGLRTGAFLAMLASIVYSRSNGRRPACDRYLGKRLSPRFCSDCGATLS